MHNDVTTTAPASGPLPRWIAASAAAAVVLSGVVFAPTAASAAVSPDAPVVISEIYGGGGNSGAVYDRDFIELANVSDADINLSGYSVQYASATGGSWQVTPLTGVTLPAGEQLLIGEAFGSNLALPDLEVDVDGSIALSGTQGKVALVSSQTALSGATGVATRPEVIDLVGWGAATHFAGAGAAPATTNATSVSRSADFANTANNSADFVTGAPTPVGLGDDETPVDPDPEPVAATIAEIQGAGATSPLVGQPVVTSGVVTAHYPTGGYNGYVIQQPGTGGDLDLASHTTSQALFVFAPGATGEVAIGDTVEVTGVVSEYEGLTEVTVAPGDAVILPDAEAPVAANVAWPTTDAQRESLESMLVAPQGDYTVSGTYSTNQYGQVGLAAGSGPLLQPTEVARPSTGEAAAVAAENAARRVTLDDGTSINFLSNANRALTPPYVSLTEPISVGGSVEFTQPVIVDWRNDGWLFNPTRPLTADGSGANDGVTFTSPRTESPEDVGGDLSIAAFNVLNYFTTLGTETASCVPYTDRAGNGVTVNNGCDQRGAWGAADLARQQAKLVGAINATDADVVGLMEIENSAALGETPDEATATLVAALNAAAGSDVWAYVPSSTDLPDASEQDVITNAVIYRTAAAEPVGESRALGDQSGDGEAFGNAREPIAQVFEPAGGGDELLFVVNHFKSKGSAGPWPGDADRGDGQGASVESRVRQATALRDWVSEIQGDTEAVALVGDFNSYSQEDPLQVLYDAGYTNASEAFDVTDETYSFQGLSGSLDHVLLNDAALERATGADIWSINGGEAVALEYSRYNSHGTLFYADDVYRSSDHDPVIVGLAAEAPPVELTLLGFNDFHGRIDNNTVGFAGTIEQLRDEASGPVVLMSAGDNIGATLFASSVAQDEPTIDVLNALDTSAVAVGNHEFDRGWEDLQGRVADRAEFELLGANVYEAGTQNPALPEYALVEQDGLTVGVIGAVTEATASLVTPAGVADLSFGDPVEAVNRVAAELTDGDAANGEADVLVAVYHEGAPNGTPEGGTLEEEVAAGGVFADIVNETAPEVAAIFTGHTHKEYAWSAPIPGTERTRPIVQTGSYGANVGEITLQLDAETSEVTAHTERLVPRTSTPAAELIAEYPRVAEVDQIVRAAQDAAAEVGNTAVGEVSADITTAFTGGSYATGTYQGGSRDNRGAESTLGNTVANMLRDQLSDLPNGAVIGVTNPGGLRAELWDTQAEFGAAAVPGLADGQISFSQANAVLPFNNTLALVSLTGEQFITMLEQQWQRAADGSVPSRSYLQLGLSDNVTYTFDRTRPEGDRIVSVYIDGQPIDPQATYRVGTFSFLASGGDNFRVFTEGADYVDTGLLDYEAWVDYIEAGSPLAPSFAKQAVEVEGVPATVTAGTEASFTVRGLNFTSIGGVANSQVTVSLGNTQLGTSTVTDGAAQVRVTIPAGTPAGQAVLTVTAPDSGTVTRVAITVEAAATVTATTTKLYALLPLHINKFLPTTLVASVSAEKGRPAGTVEFRSGSATGPVVGTATVSRLGLATLKLGTLKRGVHTFVAVFVPDDPNTLSGSTSRAATVLSVNKALK